MYLLWLKIKNTKKLINVDFAWKLGYFKGNESCEVEMRFKLAYLRKRQLQMFSNFLKKLTISAMSLIFT